MPTPSPPNTSFAAFLAKYPSTHHHRPRPGTCDCDCEFRFTTAPGLVAARRRPPLEGPQAVAPGVEESATAAATAAVAAQSGGHGWLEHPELVRLVQWKIHHGSYFASLPKLAASNDGDVVRRVTGEAFAVLASASSFTSTSDDKERIPTIMAALASLTRLRGIGPATASLLLSVADDDATVPFFADELFVWARRSFDLHTHLPLLVPKKAGFKIRYSAKEYEELLTATLASFARQRSKIETNRACASIVSQGGRAITDGAKSDAAEGNETGLGWQTDKTRKDFVNF
ncbi:hypothetical protein BKA80DRAFT_311647 [Phyllosticta citrichinensis]